MSRAFISFCRYPGCGCAFVANHGNAKYCPDCRIRSIRDKQRENRRRARQRDVTCQNCGAALPKGSGALRPLCEACREQRRLEREVRALTRLADQGNRRCHDCGKPTHNYRCADCLASWRLKHGVTLWDLAASA